MFIAQLHEWGYTFHTLYDLTPREIMMLQAGHRLLQEQRHPDGAKRARAETHKQKLKRQSKNRARRRMIEKRGNS